MKIKDILSLSDDDIDSLSSSDLNVYLSNAIRYANNRRRDALKAMANDPNLPISQAYSDWNPDQKTSWLVAKGVAQYKSWKNIEFETVGSNEKERLKIISRFLSTKTSTIAGQRKFLTDFRERLGLIERLPNGKVKTSKQAAISPDMFNEFWKIVNELGKNHLAETKFKYVIYQKRRDGKDATPVYSTTTELQRMVWDEMYKDKFQSEYDASLGIQNDEYAQRIMDRILSKVTQSYEQMEQRRLEEEEISRSEQPTGIFRGGI